MPCAPLMQVNWTVCEPDSDEESEPLSFDVRLLAVLWHAFWQALLKGGHQMTALNLSCATVKDPDLFSEYVRQAGDIMRDFGVEVVAKGNFAECVTETGLCPTVAAVFRYASLDMARSFFASEAYRALIPLRDKACDMTILLFEEGVDGIETVTADIHEREG